VRILPPLRLPHDGNSVPVIFLYFIDSIYISLFFIFVTVYMKMFVRREVMPSQWIQILVENFNKNKLGRLVMGATNAVTDEAKEATVCRQNFSRLLDRALILHFIFVYSVMYRKLKPNGRAVL
jgi:hypothetical protein